MCGLVGFIGEPKSDHLRMCEVMLFLDMLRGVDSTGVAFIGKKRTHIAKGAILPPHLLASKVYKEAQADKSAFGFIGHNRAATKGDVNSTNAHPFRVGKITLAHNGTISTYSLPGHEKFETDSETLTHAINEVGIQEIWHKVYAGTAVTFWDNEKKRLYLARNHQRPLHIGLLPDDRGLFWASEPWMMEIAAKRAGVTLHSKDMIEIKVDTLYEVQYNRKDNVVILNEERLRTWPVVSYNRNQSVIPFPNQNVNTQQQTGNTTNSNTDSGTAKKFDCVDNPNPRRTAGFEEVATILAAGEDKQSREKIIEDVTRRLVRPRIEELQKQTRCSACHHNRACFHLSEKYCQEKQAELDRAKDIQSGKHTASSTSGMREYTEKARDANYDLGKLRGIWNQYKHKWMSEEHFNKHYPNCSFCHVSLVGRFDESVVLPGEVSAICGECIEDCVDKDLTPEALRG